MPVDVKEFLPIESELKLNDKENFPNLIKILENISLPLEKQPLDRKQNHIEEQPYIDGFEPISIQKTLNVNSLNTPPILLSQIPRKSSIDNKSSAEELEVDILPQIDFLTKKKEVKQFSVIFIENLM